MKGRDNQNKAIRNLNPAHWLRLGQDALEQSVQSDPHQGVLKQSTTWAKAITWILMGGTVFGVTWLATAKTEEIVVAPGKLEPVSQVVDVQMPLQGVTKKILVKEGDSVKKGQVLVQLDTEASRDRQSSTLEALNLKLSELRLKNKEQIDAQLVSRTKINSLEESLRLEREIMDRYAMLSKQGASAELQYLQQRNKVKQIEGEIKQTKAETQRQMSVLEQNVRSLRGEIADLQSKVTEGRVTLRYQAIVAPVDGIVFELKPRSPGFVAQSSEPILKIVPIEKMQAKVEIDSSDIGFVSVGKKADISIDSFPATDFGVIQGVVSRIGSDALPPDPQQGKNYRFPANIKLDSQSLKLRDGKMLPLQVGMSLTANIKLRKVTYLQLLLGGFKDKADSLREI